MSRGWWLYLPMANELICIPYKLQMRSQKIYLYFDSVSIFGCLIKYQAISVIAYIIMEFLEELKKETNTHYTTVQNV
jgi:hypothetical protein